MSGSAGPIFATFHRMNAFWVQMIDLHFFFQYLMGIAMETNFVKKWQTPHFRRSGIQK